MSNHREEFVDAPLTEGNVGHRSVDFYKRASWFDEAGNYLSSGAICVGQPESQSRVLSPTEARIIVPARVVDAWQPSASDRLQRHSRAAPGFRFLSKEFVMVITKNQVQLAYDDQDHVEQHGHVYPTLARKNLRHFIGSLAAQTGQVPPVLFSSRG